MNAIHLQLSRKRRRHRGLSILNWKPSGGVVFNLTSNQVAASGFPNGLASPALGEIFPQPIVSLAMWKWLRSPKNSWISAKWDPVSSSGTLWQLWVKKNPTKQVVAGCLCSIHLCIWAHTSLPVSHTVAPPPPPPPPPFLPSTMHLAGGCLSVQRVLSAGTKLCLPLIPSVTSHRNTPCRKAQKSSVMSGVTYITELLLPAATTRGPSFAVEH